METESKFFSGQITKSMWEWVQRVYYEFGEG
jgi:hypothetical protein